MSGSSIPTSFIEEAYWLRKGEKAVLQGALLSSHVSMLSQEKQNKLICLLLSILYAEMKLKTQGKKLSIKIETILYKLNLQQFVCSTLGMWNFNVCHAARFGFSKWKFRQLLENNERSTEIVVRHLIEDLGLDKKPELIFAEYNHNIMATSVAAFQKALNAFSRNDVRYAICEDGLIGPETLVAIERSTCFLPEFFSLQNMNEEMILKTLEHFENAYGVVSRPCIPNVVVNKNFKFIGMILAKALKDFKKLKRLAALFERNIDIPWYVGNANEAFHFLTKGKTF